MSVEVTGSGGGRDKLSGTDSGNGNGVLVPPSIPHITTNYLPLSLIVSNLVGFSYQELQNVLETLPSVSSDLSKKRRFLDYIIKSRQAFVKLYVLSKWANVSKDVSTCVDVVSWLNGQQNCFNNVVGALHGIERLLGGAKLRNPDIETALEVLKDGRPLHKMHNFIPPTPLGAQTVQRVLRNLNVLLSVRLGLVEELPVEYRNYEICDGQVKFTMDRSFTVDLGIADDSVDARFFLVDFGFCVPIYEDAEQDLVEITDAADIHRVDPADQQIVGGEVESTPLQRPIQARIDVSSHVRARLETIVNEKLQNEKLSTVLDWLLQFAQNYKLAFFNTQLHKMVRGLYAGHIQYSFHGSSSLLVINYWCMAAHASKSTIEIGLLKDKNFKIGIRWLRDGQTVHDIPSHITDQFGSMRFDVEWLVNEIMGLHVKYLISKIYDNLKSVSLTDEYFWLDEPHKKKIKMALTDTRSVVYTIEKLSGFSLLGSPSNLVLNAERQLNENGDPGSNAHMILLKLKQASIQENITKRAEATGWISNTNITLRADDLFKVLGKSHQQSQFASVFCLRRADWGPTQFLLVSISIGQVPRWFISEINSQDREWVIKFLEEIYIEQGAISGEPGDEPSNDSGYSYKIFESLTLFSGCRFNIHYLCANLAACGVKFSLLQSSEGTPTIMVDMATISNKYTKSSNNWAHSSLIVNVVGDVITLRGRTKRQLNILSVPTQQSGVELDPHSGLFKFVLANNSHASVDFVRHISKRLSQVERVVEYIELVRSLSLDLVSASMDSIKFAYGNESNLTATISLPQAEGPNGPISLLLDKDSPHSIVVAHLQQVLTQGGLLPVVWILQATLPLYKALQKLVPTAIIVPHTVGDVQVYFDQEHIIQMELKSKKTVYVTNAAPWAKIEPLWSLKGDDQVVPLKKGLACHVDRIEAILENVKKYI